MKKIFLLVFSCLLGFLVKAQDFNEVNSMLVNLKLNLLPEAKDFGSSNYLSQYEGTPFLENEWKEGIIRLKTGKDYRIPMKYCIYTDQIWLKSGEDSISALNLSNQLVGVRIDKRNFVYQTYTAGDKHKTGIMEVLYDGKNKLYKLYTCTLEKGREGDGYQGKEKDKFVKKEKLYYQLGSKEAQVLPRSKKELFPLFGEKRQEVEKYFKSNKLKMKEEDIVKAFNYYDSLQ